MVTSLVASRAAIALRAAVPQARAFTVSAVAGKDFVQEAYLRELKAYKAPPKAADAHVGQVREFSTPNAPTAPSVPSSSELSSLLDSYASSEPDHAAKDASAASSGLTEGGDVKAYLAEAAKPIEKEAAHH